MPRPRTHDRDAVLQAAMRTFWAVGYEATSTEALCEATGLGRGSLYHAFTSKHALFVATLDRYMAERTAALVDLLEGEGSAKDRIRDLLWASVDPDPDEPTGCFLVNTMAELGPVDAEIAEAVRRDERRRLDALRVAIAAGQREGTISARRTPTELAQFVVSTIGGVNVATRCGADRVAREAIMTTALDAL